MQYTLFQKLRAFSLAGILSLVVLTFLAPLMFEVFVPVLKAKLTQTGLGDIAIISVAIWLGLSAIFLFMSLYRAACAARWYVNCFYIVLVPALVYALIEWASLNDLLYNFIMNFRL